MSISPDIRKRLLYAKYLLARARSTQAEQHELGVAVSLLLMHDVDVVVQLNDVWYYDDVGLSLQQRQMQQQTYPDAVYSATDWRSHVENALRKKLGSAVKGGAKAIKVATGPGNMTADVLPAVQFKKYVYFYSKAVQNYIEGIKFSDATGTLTTNYPKLHIANGEGKNKNGTGGYYKQSVRMFKNARNCLMDRGLLRTGIAPSYFVECLLYNVPDENFGGSFAATYFNVVKYLLSYPMNSFLCQNGQLALFGSASTQWNTIDATSFVHGLANLWDRW